MMLRGDLLFIDARTPKPVYGSGRPDWLPKALEEVPLFHDLSGRQLKRVVKLVQPSEYVDGAKIVRAGSRGEGFHMVLDGSVRVEFPSGDAETLKPGDCFGELALLDGAPRSATVVAVGPAKTGWIPRKDFKRLLQDEPSIAAALLPGLVRIVRQLQGSVGGADVTPWAGSGSEAVPSPAQDASAKRLLEWKLALHQVPVFDPLPDNHLRRVAKLFTTKRYRGGRAIVREGDRGDSFMIVIEGRALAQGRDGSTQELPAGSSFGELALIDGEPRSATVSAIGDVTVAVITRRSFLDLVKKEPRLAIGLAESLVRLIRMLETKPA